MIHGVPERDEPPSGRVVPTVVGRLHVRVTGQGPPALLWHSLVTDSSVWQRVEPELARHRTLVLVDGPGHGASGLPPRRFGTSDCATAALQILDTLGYGTVDWVGTGWGARVGLAAAVGSPDRIRSAVLFGALDMWRPWWKRAAIRAALSVHAVVGAVAPLAEFLMRSTLGDRRRRIDPEAAVTVSSALRKISRRGASRVGMSELQPVRPTDEVGPLVTAPTLVVVGEESPRPALAYAERLVEAAPHARLVIVEHVFELVPLEEPEAAVELVLEHWSRTAS